MPPVPIAAPARSQTHEFSLSRRPRLLDTVRRASDFTSMPKPDAPPTTDLTAAPTGRNASVDVLRGLVMCTMVFVNDVAGVHGVPWWMKHYTEGSKASGMT